MQLIFIAPDATNEERARGLAAAISFFQRAGISIEEAKRGADARTAWGDSGLAPLHLPTHEQIAAAEAWDNALESALMACYRGRNVPLGADLQVEPEAPDAAAS